MVDNFFPPAVVKTLNMSIVEQFFSMEYAGWTELFEGLSIWQHEDYRRMQGRYPVISLYFANVKENNYPSARAKICQILINLYAKHYYLRDSDVLTDKAREYFDRISSHMEDNDATLALYQLSDYLYRYHGKKVIILLDEYDTPMQEAWVGGYWDEIVSFIRSLFNSTFKTNPWLERGLNDRHYESEQGVHLLRPQPSEGDNNDIGSVCGVFWIYGGRSVRRTGRDGACRGEGKCQTLV